VVAVVTGADYVYRALALRRRDGGQGTAARGDGLGGAAGMNRVAGHQAEDGAASGVRRETDAG
jgi:hypothetical protein